MFRQQRGRTYNTGRRHFRCDRRNQLFGHACRTDLGLGKMDTPTKTANLPGDVFRDRILLCNSVSRHSLFVACVCSSSALSVLRSVASQNISVGNFAFSCRNRVWQIDHSGNYYKVNARLYDPPTQTIPLLMAGNGPKAMRRCGQYADGLITDPKTWKEHKRIPEGSI